MATHDLADVAAIKAWYLDEVHAYLGERWLSDRSISVPAAEWLRDWAQTTQPRAVLDLGSGLSTIVLALALPPTTRLLTSDHDCGWLSFVEGLVRPLRPDLEVAPLDEYRGTTRPAKRRRPWSMVFVDHGPLMRTRLQDWPWLQTLAPLLVFDDFGQPYNRPTIAWRRNMRAALTAAGWSLELVADSGRKCLGVARRPEQ